MPRTAKTKRKSENVLKEVHIRGEQTGDARRYCCYYYRLTEKLRKHHSLRDVFAHPNLPVFSRRQSFTNETLQRPITTVLIVRSENDTDSRRGSRVLALLRRRRYDVFLDGGDYARNTLYRHAQTRTIDLRSAIDRSI